MDNLEQLYLYVGSADYRHMMQTFSWVSLLLAIGFVFLSLALYVQGRDLETTDETAAPWGLIVATLRDSFLITILYVSEGLLWRFSNFQQSSEVTPAQFWLYGPIIDPILSLFVLLLVFTITFLRALALNRWLKEQSAE